MPLVDRAQSLRGGWHALWRGGSWPCNLIIWRSISWQVTHSIRDIPHIYAKCGDVTLIEYRTAGGIVAGVAGLYQQIALNA